MTPIFVLFVPEIVLSIDNLSAPLSPTVRVLASVVDCPMSVYRILNGS